MNFYNDNDPKACAWLRELIAQGHLPPGDVVCQSITDIKPHELEKYIQCHFFAGIGGWPLALLWADWPADEPVWTGSCPCQPLSSAGQRKGHADQRHLWPAFYRLIAECRPATIFGEQVASKDGREWLAGVRADLEGSGYAIGAANLPACSVGAPHKRERLFWGASRTGQLADAAGRQCQQRLRPQGNGLQRPAEHRANDPVADAECDGRRTDQPGRQPEKRIAHGRAGCAMDDACGGGLQGHEQQKLSGIPARLTESPGRSSGIACDAMGHPASRGCGIGGDAPQPRNGGHLERPSGTGFDHQPAWENFETVLCRDGKTRRFESGSFPLAYGVPGRVGLLRGYGNAIVPQVAEKFIRAYRETCAEMLRKMIATA